MAFDTVYEAGGTRGGCANAAARAGEIDTTFESHYSSRISLAEAITVEAVKDYGARKTGQKTLLHMAGHPPDSLTS